mmetsp:Transcript_40848/g.68420  ORF Transcript_40848/g.68420 Transcript_40848/m.68420 type:complete len:234 (+) Transcript_40848:493-1194(+)
MIATKNGMYSAFVDHIGFKLDSKNLEESAYCRLCLAADSALEFSQSPADLLDLGVFRKALRGSSHHLIACRVLHHAEVEDGVALGKSDDRPQAHAAAALHLHLALVCDHGVARLCGERLQRTGPPLLQLRHAGAHVHDVEEREAPPLRHHGVFSVLAHAGGHHLQHARLHQLLLHLHTLGQVAQQLVPAPEHRGVAHGLGGAQEAQQLFDIGAAGELLQVVQAWHEVPGQAVD